MSDPDLSALSRLVHWAARLDDSPVGDAAGVIVLFGSLYGLLWLTPILEEWIK